MTGLDPHTVVPVYPPAEPGTLRVPMRVLRVLAFLRMEWDIACAAGLSGQLLDAEHLVAAGAALPAGTLREQIGRRAAILLRLDDHGRGR